MSLDLTETQRNIICVLQQFDKSKITAGAIMELIPGETPNTFTIDEPGAPMVFSFRRAGFEVLFIENRLHIQSSAPKEARAAREFSDLVVKVFDACSDLQLTAYGFNFVFIFSGQSVVDIFGIRKSALKLPHYSYLNEAFVQLSYTKDTVKFILDIRDTQPKMQAHVNVHYEQPIKISELRPNVKELYECSLQDAIILLEEVLGGNG